MTDLHPVVWWLEVGRTVPPLYSMLTSKQRGVTLGRARLVRSKESSITSDLALSSNTNTR